MFWRCLDCRAAPVLSAAKRHETSPGQLGINRKNAMEKPLDELITDLLRPIFPELRSEALEKLLPIMRVALRICEPTTMGKLAYLAPFAAASTIVGAISIQTRELVKGRTPRDMSMPSFWTDALQQGGALTVFEAALQADTGFERALMQAGGPGLGLAKDVFDLSAGNIAQALENIG